MVDTSCEGGVRVDRCLLLSLLSDIFSILVNQQDSM